MFIRPEEKEINFKLVFWGPACSGKTTCLNVLERQFGTRKKTESMPSPERTLFFDFLPLKVQKIKGLSAHFHLYTVPGQAPYRDSRSMLLKGVDGLMLVLDSQIERGSENHDSLQEMRAFLEASCDELSKIPMVFAYNKQDLDATLSLDEMNRLYNPQGAPAFATVAARGKNVVESFSALLEQVIAEAKKKPL